VYDIDFKVLSMKINYHAPPRSTAHDASTHNYFITGALLLVITKRIISLE
jgi:hypothetical protein